MKMLSLALVAALAASSLAIPAADARDDHRPGWNDGKHHGWNNRHRRCWTEWRHHHKVRRCR
jgi:Ni/Co efflux regulator RcnB